MVRAIRQILSPEGFPARLPRRVGPLAWHALLVKPTTLLLLPLIRGGVSRASDAKARSRTLRHKQRPPLPLAWGAFVTPPRRPYGTPSPGPRPSPRCAAVRCRRFRASSATAGSTRRERRDRGRQADRARGAPPGEQRQGEGPSRSRAGGSSRSRCRAGGALWWMTRSVQCPRIGTLSGYPRLPRPRPNPPSVPPAKPPPRRHEATLGVLRFLLLLSQVQLHSHHE